MIPSFRVYTIVLLGLLAHTVSAQETDPAPEAIKLLSKSKTSGIWLRWAPTNYATWQLGNRYGYIVERVTLRPDGEAEHPTPDVLTPAPLRPIPASEMETLSATVKEIAVVQELIYGDDAANNTSPGNIAAIITSTRAQENRYGIAMLMCDLYLPVAKAAAVFWEDKTAVKGQRYIYRIRLAQQPKNAILQPAATVITHTEEKPLATIKDVTATFGNRTATLSWPVMFHKGIYAAYHIERSADGKTFTRVSDLPYIPMSESNTIETAHFTDSLTTNNTTWHYRITGVSAFGETGVPSANVSGAGKDDLSGLLSIREGKTIEKKKVRIAWEFPQEHQKQITHFGISRSNNPDGPYTDLATKTITPDKREFIDETPYNNTYYQVKAINKTRQHIAVSFPYLIQIEDNTPPAIPAGLGGTIDKNGTVNLSWKPNTDSDLMGYRVFYTNSLKGELVETTKQILNTPRFTGTINISVLNKKIYFAVVAVDKNYNASDYSKPVLLYRPDIIAPAAPVFSKTESTAQGIELTWINSPSNDIARYTLLRRSNTDTINHKINEWLTRDNKTTYRDNAPLGNTYQYTLQAYDSAGNSAQVISGNIFHETGIREAVTDFKAVIDRDKKAIIVKWKEQPAATRYTIYRKENDGPTILFKTLQQGTTSLTDKDIRINNHYEYKIQIIYDTGVRSKISDALKVDY